MSKILMLIILSIYAILAAINIYLINTQKPVELKKYIKAIVMPVIDSQGRDKDGNIYYYNSQGKKKYRVYID